MKYILHVICTKSEKIKLQKCPYSNSTHVNLLFETPTRFKRTPLIDMKRNVLGESSKRTLSVGKFRDWGEKCRGKVAELIFRRRIIERWGIAPVPFLFLFCFDSRLTVVSRFSILGEWIEFVIIKERDTNFSN